MRDEEKAAAVELADVAPAPWTLQDFVQAAILDRQGGWGDDGPQLTTAEDRQVHAVQARWLDIAKASVATGHTLEEVGGWTVAQARTVLADYQRLRGVRRASRLRVPRRARPRPRSRRAGASSRTSSADPGGDSDSPASSSSWLGPAPRPRATYSYGCPGPDARGEATL